MGSRPLLIRQRSGQDPQREISRNASPVAWSVIEVEPWCGRHTHTPKTHMRKLFFAQAWWSQVYHTPVPTADQAWDKVHSPEPGRHTVPPLTHPSVESNTSVPLTTQGQAFCCRWWWQVGMWLLIWLLTWNRNLCWSMKKQQSTHLFYWAEKGQMRKKITIACVAFITLTQSIYLDKCLHVKRISPEEKATEMETRGLECGVSIL